LTDETPVDLGSLRVLWLHLSVF